MTCEVGVEAVLNRKLLERAESAYAACCSNCRWLKSAEQFGKVQTLCTLMPRQMLVIPQVLIGLPVPPEVLLRNPNATMQQHQVQVAAVYPPVERPADESCVMFEPNQVQLDA